MNRIRDLIKQKRKQQSARKVEQNRTASLSMSVSNMIIPLLLDIVQTNKGSLTLSSYDQDLILRQFATDFPEVFDNQKQLVALVSANSGGLVEGEEYVYRRTLKLASKMCKNDGVFDAVQMGLHLINNDETSIAIRERLCVPEQEFVDFIQESFKTNRYQSDDTFWGSLDESLIQAMSTIQFALNKIDWCSTPQEDIRQLTVDSLSVITSKIYNRQATLPSDHQRNMLLKSAVKHGSKLVKTALIAVASHHNEKVDIFDNYDEFTEQVTDLLMHIEAAHHACQEKFVNILWTLESEFKPSLELTASRSPLSVSELLTMLDVFSRYPNTNNLTRAQLAKDIIESYTTTQQLSAYLLESIDNNLCRLESESVRSYGIQQSWSCIDNAYRSLKRQNALIDNRILKAAVNVVNYLLSDQPSDNSVLSKYGLDAVTIDSFRTLSNIAFPAESNRPLKHKKFTINIACELTNTLIKTNSFSWGMSSAYVAGQICTTVLKQAHKLYVDNIDLVKEGHYDAVTAFECFLSCACDIYVSHWQQEVDETLTKSSQNYVRGEITIVKAEEIMSELKSQFIETLESLSYNATLARKDLDLMVENLSLKRTIPSKVSQEEQRNPQQQPTSKHPNSPEISLGGNLHAKI